MNVHDELLRHIEAIGKVKGPIWINKRSREKISDREIVAIAVAHEDVTEAFDTVKKLVTGHPEILDEPGVPVKIASIAVLHPDNELKEKVAEILQGYVEDAGLFDAGARAASLLQAMIKMVDDEGHKIVDTAKLPGKFTHPGPGETKPDGYNIRQEGWLTCNLHLPRCRAAPGDAQGYDETGGKLAHHALRSARPGNRPAEHKPQISGQMAVRRPRSAG